VATARFVKTGITPGEYDQMREKLLVGIAQSVVQHHREPATCTVSADRDMSGCDALLAQKVPRGQGILHCRRERMLGRQPISHRQRSYPR